METIFEILVMSAMKTADVNFFLEIIKKCIWWYMYLLFFVTAESKIMTGCAILHFPI